MENPIVYLVIGPSGCGKSWAARQVTDKFHYVPHDRCYLKAGQSGWDPRLTWAADMKDASRYEPGAKSNHLEVLIAATKIANRPVISEVPFAERVLREGLEKAGIRVVPVFVIEPPEVVAQRYAKREGKYIPAAALTRASTIITRAKDWKAFHGTSDEVLAYLKGV